MPEHFQAAQRFNPATAPDACSVPVNTPPPINGAPLCASNADCAADQWCVSLTNTCTGVGFCTTRSDCGFCDGPDGPCVLCGCDGVTYANNSTACAAGARIASSGGGCGEPVTVGGGGSGSVVTIRYCGADDQCLPNQRCCARTGECFDADKPALCDPPPDGTERSCYTDADCYYGVCVGDGCEGPGGCRHGGRTCSSVLDPVCGCDGQTYTNADCAANEGIRVASSGECD